MFFLSSSEVARVQLIENQQRKNRIQDTLHKHSVSLSGFNIEWKWFLHLIKKKTHWFLQREINLYTVQLQ